MSESSHHDSGQQDSGRQDSHLSDAWLDRVIDAARAPSGAAEGRVGTADVPAAFERAVGHTRALFSLPRLDAPSELDGLVVASQHAGFQQERALAHVRDLRPLRAPAVLDDLVLARITADVVDPVETAPPELDGLVEGVVSDSSAFVAKSMTAKLPGLEAPADLAARVENLVEESKSGAHDLNHGPHEGEASRSRRRLLVGAAVAFSLALVGLFNVPAARDAGPGGGEASTVTGSTVDVVSPGDVSPGGAAKDAGSTPQRRPSLTFVRIEANSLSRSDLRTMRALGATLVGGNS